MNPFVLLAVGLLLTAVLVLIVISVIFVVRRPRDDKFPDQGIAMKACPESDEDMAGKQD